jgi:mannosyltransferase OCH1-like enzyme
MPGSGKGTSLGKIVSRRAPPGGTKAKVPRMIYQTFQSVKVPFRMLAAVHSWQLMNPEWGYEFFDDTQMAGFVANFDCSAVPFDSRDLARAFGQIRPGAGKADLFRYLLVYERGGVYMDIDTVCLAPLSRYVASDDDVVTGIGCYGDFHQWGLVYSPRHPFLLCAIENAIANILDRRFVPGFEGSLEGLTGPPCLDKSIKQILGLPLQERFMPGTYRVALNGVAYQIRIMDGDFFGGQVGFKYAGYEDDLAQLGVRYWQDDELFNE